MLSDGPTRTVSDPQTVTTARNPDDPRTLPCEVEVALDVAHPLAPPGYVIERELGRGGMGVVYQAQQVGLKRTVALKLSIAGDQLTPVEWGRFRTEAEALADVSHSQVVQVFDYGEHDRRPFLALEYLPGGTLAARLRGEPLAPRDAAALVAGLARAVAAIHARGIVHRDLKPGNVLFDADGTPKVADFGLAKRELAGTLTATGAVMGTPAYMAPEQAAGQTREAGPAADIYALGAILYHTLTGGPPFRGGEVVALLRAVVEVAPTPPREVNPAVARDLETICLKCLAKNPAERYPTATMLADDLIRFTAGEPIRARPPGPVRRLNLWVRRDPVTAVAAVAAAVGVGLGVWAYPVEPLVLPWRLRVAAGAVWPVLIPAALVGGLGLTLVRRWAAVVAGCWGVAAAIIAFDSSHPATEVVAAVGLAAVAAGGSFRPRAIVSLLTAVAILAAVGYVVGSGAGPAGRAVLAGLAHGAAWGVVGRFAAWGAGGRGGVAVVGAAVGAILGWQVATVHYPFLFDRWSGAGRPLGTFSAFILLLELEFALLTGTLAAVIDGQILGRRR